MRKTILQLENKLESVMIVDGKWSDQDNLDRVRRSREWSVWELNLSWNQRVEVMKDISHIRFTRLAVLSLVGNMIDSIEGIVEVTVPCLRDLILSDNNIRYVRELRKPVWGSLSFLSIENNPIADSPHLSQGCFSKLTHLWMDNQEKSHRFSDHCFLPKLQSLSLSQLLFASEELFFTSSIKAVLQKRWKDISIH